MKFNLLAPVSVVADLAFSFPCPGCGMAPVSPRNALCPSCRAELHLFAPPYCPGCGATLDNALDLCSDCLREERRPWQNAIALFPHQGLGRELIHRFKYRDAPEIARTLAILGAEALRDRGLQVDCIVPVPLHWTRRWWRGFNQTALFCARLSAETGIPVRDCLDRIRRTRRQARLNREQRKKNLLAAFSLKDRNFCPEGNILLIDDVLTTGATLSAAAHELLRAGGERTVYIMAPARR